MIRTLTVDSPRPGLNEITAEVTTQVAAARIDEGLLTLFVQHTSASLVIQENADPSAARDLEAFLARLVPESDPHYTHTLEGPDDMPAHVRAALTAVSLSIPIAAGRPALGTWQGIFLWEHRRRPGPRRIIMHMNH